MQAAAHRAEALVRAPAAQAGKSARRGGADHEALLNALPIASAVIARRLARGEEVRRGARPCFQLVTLDEFDGAVADLDITWSVERTV